MFIEGVVSLPLEARNFNERKFCLGLTILRLSVINFTESMHQGPMCATLLVAPISSSEKATS